MIDRTLHLAGPHVRLEPLALAHLESLRQSCDDPALWEFTAQKAAFETEEGSRAWLDDALNVADQVPFAIVDNETNAAIGSTRYADIQPANRKVEIGWTFIARRFWRTHVNTECKFLLLRFAFEDWKAVRVSLKANAINHRSRTAIERIGATYEGTLRNFRMNPRTGRPIDSSYYSIIDSEWPTVKARLEQMIDGVRTA